MRCRSLLAAALAATLPLGAGCSTFAPGGAADSPPSSPQTEGGEPADRDEEGRGEEGPAPFEEVVPASAETDTGLFTVHRTHDRLLFQIPDSLLGREMLLISRIARVPSDFGGYTPAGSSAQEQVLAWERHGDRVFLRKRSYEQVADDTLPIALSVVNNNIEPIVEAFDVEAIGPDSASVVVDVTDFYEDDTPAISGLGSGARQEYGVRGLDSDRSFMNWARSFPRNVDVRLTQTFNASSPPSNANVGAFTLEMHHSMVLLPEEPMRPRYADERVGYFSVRRVNFGLPTQKAAEETFIRRWRIEPSDPDAYAAGELVEPVRPITYYLDPATPDEWRSCVRQGVEDWNAAFETAGFRDAIRALDAPSPQEDPEWDAADVRNSVVRWAASTTRNAQGPSVSDPRTGEIIESDIVWYHNHMRSYRNRIMLETGAANPAARSLPIDRGLMCEAMQQVIAHEIGHALGLPHNMISSSAYPVDSLRSPSFAQRMGVAPSIMDYARQNYIAQPGDGLEGADFIRQIGPYDHYAIDWGYRIFPDAPTPDAERAVLDSVIVAHADDPTYRFGGTGPDPRAQTEDLGDDPMRAGGYGIANLRRVTPRLVEWTTAPGEDYADLDELYGELVGQWSRYVNHMVAVVGGIYADRKTADQPGPAFRAVPRKRQERAVAFLAEHVFEAPLWLANRDILDRIGESGFETLSGRQATVLERLLDAGRLARIAETAVSRPEAAYPLPDYLDDMEAAVWSDPAATAADPYRRALHRAWVSAMEELMTGTGDEVERTDVRPLARSQLASLRENIGSAAGRTGDRTARAHLEDLEERIRRILEEVPPPTAGDPLS